MDKDDLGSDKEIVTGCFWQSFWVDLAHMSRTGHIKSNGQTQAATVSVN
jgi:hypothetical protein